MSSKQVEALLNELCVALGFCLPPDLNERLKNHPPASIDEFTDTVIRAEGLKPSADIPLHLLRDVRARVAKHFSNAEKEFISKREQETAPTADGHQSGHQNS